MTTPFSTRPDFLETTAPYKFFTYLLTYDDDDDDDDVDDDVDDDDDDDDDDKSPEYNRHMSYVSREIHTRQDGATFQVVIVTLPCCVCCKPTVVIVPSLLPGSLSPLSWKRRRRGQIELAGLLSLACVTVAESPRH